jgi:AcrR family transcriptional regulator
MDREEIIEQAMAVVDAEGDDALSVRGLARKLGVSAPALYEYIESRDELLRLLAQRGYDELADRREGLDGSPTEWLWQAGRVYVAFAVERPNLFALMHRFGPGAILGEAGGEHPAATALFDEGIDRIRAAVTAGELRGEDPVELAVALWAAAHGVANAAVLAPGLVDHEVLVDLVIGGLLEAWRPPNPRSTPNPRSGT